MYPNPQDVLPLPSRPDVEHYRKRAKDLAKACRSGDDAIHEWAANWVENLINLSTVARSLDKREAEGSVRDVSAFARERLTRADCALSQAQFVIARAHGFASWPKLAQHIEEIRRKDSHIAAFEEGVDLIVKGDLPALARLLAANPDLVRVRSTREHHAALLHYVSANGVENYRQKTPPNIVAVARHLLDAGAEVDAEADVYGGGCTAFGLVVTSAHPRSAGVQIPLADLLLERGARMDAGIVRSCLANGCPEAAAHLAARGAPLTGVDAAGIGRLDVLARLFVSSSSDEAVAALLMASWYDQREAVTFLLDHGVDVGARDPQDGDTALHHAAYTGNVALAELLLRRGAKPEWLDKDERLREQADLYRVLLRRAKDEV